MKYKLCPFCKNLIYENDNYCKTCGANVVNFQKKDLNNKQDNKTDSEKIFNILAIVSTIIFLIIYILNWVLWNGLYGLGGNRYNDVFLFSNLERFISVCAGSMIFSFVPNMIAIIFSIPSKNRLLISFNIIFLIIHILFIFSGV